MPRTVVITGAGAGVGRAVATEFARSGCNVALLARDRERLEAAAREARALGASALVVTVDVADAAAVDEAAGRVERELGPIDVWVNVAMATVFSPVHAITPEEFRRVTEVTYLGYVHGTLAALKRMRPRDRGTIVQVGSALSYRAIPLQAAYCGAKFAIRGFTDALRSELLHDRSRIRLTMVQLPAVDTPQFDWARSHMPNKARPVPPIYDPETVAGEIVRAARRTPRELWVGVSAVKAIVGGMLVPGFADRLLATRGYTGQTTSEPRPPNPPDNLFQPPPGDPGARGRFAAQAQSRVRSFDPAWLGAGALLGLIGALAGAFALGHAAGRSRRPPHRGPSLQHASQRALQEAQADRATLRTLARR